MKIKERKILTRFSIRFVLWKVARRKQKSTEQIEVGGTSRKDFLAI